MVRKTPEQAQKIIRRLVADLERPTALAERYARAVLDQALQNAAGRPTPQAPMAAQNLTVEGSLIRPLAGGPAEEVAQGAEFGSSIYRQFQAPHTSEGYWLLSAGEAQAVVAAGDRMLENVIEAAIRGF